MNHLGLVERAKYLVEKATASGIKICTAESCTGGLVASSIVSVSGASAMFSGSAVCYEDNAKMKILGVSEETLGNHFAESAECAREMALGALKLFDANLSIATTGFVDANVSQKSAELAGRVFLCVCGKSSNGELSFVDKVVTLNPAGDRNENRAEVVAVALDTFLSQIELK